MNLKTYMKQESSISVADYHCIYGRKDWDQEGMLCLYELVSRNPELLEGEASTLCLPKQSLEIVF